MNLAGIEFIGLEDSPEFLECDMEQAYPGLPSHCYRSITQESQHRSNGGKGGREWAMTTCKLAWLATQKPADDSKDEEYFS